MAAEGLGASAEALIFGIFFLGVPCCNYSIIYPNPI